MRMGVLSTFMVISFFVCAQKETIPVTENFSIEGKVKKDATVSLADLSHYRSYSIDSIVIRNHLGERKSTLKNV